MSAWPSQAVALRLQARFDDWVAVWAAMNARGPVWGIERLRITPQGGEVAMEKVLCPTLFLLGRQDVMTPPEAVATLQSRARQGQTALIDSGHALMSDNPEGLMAALRDFLPVAPAR
jgi:pimeloyl-ACP methyl ester carboxylesterase